MNDRERRDIAELLSLHENFVRRISHWRENGRLAGVRSPRHTDSDIVRTRTLLARCGEAVIEVLASDTSERRDTYLLIEAIRVARSRGLARRAGDLLLRHAHPMLRGWAHNLLAQTRASGYVADNTTGLDDGDEWVRAMAAQGLFRVGRARRSRQRTHVRERLEEKVRDLGEAEIVRLMALQSLARFKDATGGRVLDEIARGPGGPLQARAALFVAKRAPKTTPE